MGHRVRGLLRIWRYRYRERGLLRPLESGIQAEEAVG